MRKVLIAAIAVTFFAGCSTIPMEQAPQATVDTQYMAAVENAAKRYGTQVVWLNLPQKRATSTQ